MLNCAALITRTGHLNTSNTIVLASKGMNMQRHVSTITKNKFLRSQLLTLSSRSLLELQSTNNGRVLAPHIISKCISSSYTRSLCLRKIHINLRTQCSHCTTDVRTNTNVTNIAKDDINSQRDIEDAELTRSFRIKNIFDNEPESVEHRTHSRKEHELKISDIDRLYPSAKGKIHDIYVSVGSQLKQPKALTIQCEQSIKDKRIWHCIYRVQWPEEMAITATASNKSGAIKMGALKTLQWLHNTGKLKNGHPVVYESKVVMDMLKKPTPIIIEPETLETVKNLLERYNSEISDVIANSNDNEKIRDISISSTNLLDPVGRSLPENWNPANRSHRNSTLRNRLEYIDLNTSKELPIAEYKNTILREIENNRALLIKGDTGCGKTTQVPRYIMDSFIERGQATDCNMIVSQPRRISAISLAERIAEERNEHVGDVVGYQVRLKQVLPQTPGGMLFCTTGILLKKMQSNPSLKGVSHVILDEAHERSINTDMLLVLLKRALDMNPDLKVIVMSATINADLFQQYFNCGVVEVPGRTYPVKMNFLDDIHKLGVRSRREYVGEKEFPETPFVDCEQIGELITWISKNKPQGAILCFLPGWAEIVKVKKYLEESRQRNYRDLIVPVHSRMAHADQRKIFAHPAPGVRKIVLATDIAETGITVTDVVYVVDSATRKAMRWHEKEGLATMDNQYASQANILQRKGRAGRVQPGESYHFVTEAQFKNFDIHPLPEVLRSSLEKTVLDCKTYSDEKAESFLGSMPQPPTLSAVRKAVSDLAALGAIDQHENLTPLGKRIALFTVHPKLSKAIVYSSIFQCVAPMVTIASAMSAENEIFTGTLYDKEAIRRIKQKYHPTSDHISIAWLFAQWATVYPRGREATNQFCWKSKLFPERMFTLSKVRDLHADNLAQCHMIDHVEEYDDMNSPYNEFADLDELVRGVLLSGLDQLLHQRDFELKKHKVKKGTSVFVMEDGMRATVTPESVNFKRKSWPSPFLTYVRRQHSEERRISLVRETSMIAPITALLFCQGQIHGFQQQSKENTAGFSNNDVVLTVKGTKNFRLSCDPSTAGILLQFRDSMWSIVRYLVDKHGLVENSPGSDHHKVENFKQNMLQVLAKMLSEAAQKIDTPEGNRNRLSSDDEDSDE